MEGKYFLLLKIFL